MATEIWVNIGSGNGLLPEGTKPLPEPMLIYHQWGPLAFIWVQFYKRYFSHQSLKLVGKLLTLKFLWNIPGANELIVSGSPQLCITTLATKEIQNPALNPKTLHFINSLAPGRFQFNFRKVIFKLISVNCGWGISYEIALRWISKDLTDDKSTLVQVMAWCREAASHYLSQCWPRSMSPNGITRPQCVKSLCHHSFGNAWPYT